MCDDDVELSRDLDLALSLGQLSLAYQPKVSLVSGRISGAEALLRWTHPSVGAVPPPRFVPLAERSGSIVSIGAWVLTEACRQASAWNALPERDTSVRVAVNVSARQFCRGLVDMVRGVLEGAGMEPSQLCLELTETAVMEDLSSAADVFAALAALGVQLSIDDFGTGYSSLAYLKRLPFHELKIDKSFVDGLGADPDSTAIVAAVIAMAQALGLAVVAEGVERASQLEALRDLGCDEAQGYHLARPMAALALDELLRRDIPTTAMGAGPPSSLSAAPVGRSKDVLIVEDADDVRKLARVSLAAAGFAVHEAVDGEAALVEARRVQPACVLLDLALPFRDGLEVCEALRSDPATAECAIVILSTSSDAASKIAAFTRGADDYIMKPASPRELAERVRVAMERRRQAPR